MSRGWQTWWPMTSGTELLRTSSASPAKRWCVAPLASTFPLISGVLSLSVSFFVLSLSCVKQAVGLAAKHGILRNRSNTAAHFYALLGQPHSAAQTLVNAADLCCALEERDGHPVLRFENRPEPLTVSELTTTFIRCLRDTAITKTGAATGCVVAIPPRSSKKKKK